MNWFGLFTAVPPLMDTEMKPVALLVGSITWINVSETTALVFVRAGAPVNLTLNFVGAFPPGAKPLPPMFINVPKEPMGGMTLVML